MLTIGEFSRAGFVSKKTLRYYDEIGLLRPEHTAENGYRYYTAEQLRTMLMITRLKGYGFSLPEVAAVLARGDSAFLEQKLLEKRAALAAQVEDTRRLLLQLDCDVDRLKRREDFMENKITVKTVELAPQPIYSSRNKISITEISSRICALMDEAEKKGIPTAKIPMIFYHDEEFRPEDYDVEFALAVTNPADATRVRPGGLHCMTVLTGPYTQEAFTAAYAGLVQWTQDNGYRICNAAFDCYVRGGDVGSNPADNLTEIYVPITK